MKKPKVINRDPGWPQLGDLAYDEHRQRGGIVVQLPDDSAPFYLLRPEGGGADWAVPRGQNLTQPRQFHLREHTIAPDIETDAEPHTYAMQCIVCSEKGPESTAADEAHAWVPTHLRAHPRHLTYREHLTRSYRAVAGRWL